jgi:hypothetical protein
MTTGRIETSVARTEGILAGDESRQRRMAAAWAASAENRLKRAKNGDSSGRSIADTGQQDKGDRCIHEVFGNCIVY